MRAGSIASVLSGAVTACLLWAAPSPTPGEVAKGAMLPAGYGLSARYPGDRGIERDEAALLTEDFETGTLEDLGDRWESVKNPDRSALALVPDAPPHDPGHRSLQITATLHRNTGGYLYRRLPRGVDTAYARFYVRFSNRPEYIHHFVHLGGYRPSTRWPQGGAGERPRGDERMTVGIEPWGRRGEAPPPGVWNFYNYWHEMKIHGDGRYWGNPLRPVRDHQVPAGRWQCVEVMMKCNSEPRSHDGELALWLDGRPAAHFIKGVPRSPWNRAGFHLLEEGGEPFQGFCWRTTNELKINFFWLLHYVTPNAARQNRVEDPRTVNPVRFDNIVVATEYIGPIAPAENAPR